MLRPLLACLIILSISSTAAGEWATGFHVTGFDGETYCSTAYGEGLVVGGRFAAVGEVAARNVVYFDGQTWSSLGDGLPMTVWKIMAAGDELVALCGSTIGIFDGNSWRLIPAPEEVSPSGAVCVWKGDIFLGEYCWDGVVWTRYITVDDDIHDLTVFQDNLVIAGSFNHVNGMPLASLVTWNGGYFEQIPVEHKQNLWGAEVWDDRLVVHMRYGYVETVDDVEIYHEPVMAYDGSSWTELPHLSAQLEPLEGRDIKSLISVGDRLFAHMHYWDMYHWGSDWDYITVYDGEDWSNIPYYEDGMRIIGTYGEDVLAGGSFEFVDEMHVNSLVFIRDDQIHHDFTPGVGVRRQLVHMAVSDESQYVSGYFPSPNAYTTDYLARWGGSDWTMLERPFSIPPYRISRPGEICYHEGMLAFNWSGEFYSDPYPIPGHRISLVDGLEWMPGASSLDVHDLTSWNGLLYGLRRDEVIELEPGVGCTTFASTEDGWPWVWGLHVHDGNLIAGGTFDTIDGVAVPGFAVHDGFDWTPVEGSGVIPNDFATWRGCLIAIGPDDQGLLPGRELVMCREPEGWQQLGGAVEGKVHVAYAYNGALFIAGEFDAIDGEPMSNIACWRSGHWVPVGGGLDDRAIAMGVANDQLWIAGDFNVAGNIPSSSIAIWTEEPTANEVLWFNADRQADGVQVSWELATPLNWTLELHRVDESGAVQCVTELPATNNTLGAFLDTQPLGTTSSYRLASQVRPGETLTLAETALGDLPALARSAITTITPNPFNPESQISFNLEKPGHVNVGVYDLQGRLIRTLIAEAMSAGPHSVNWNGRSDADQPAASGTYVFRMETDGKSWAKKAQLVR